MSCEIWHRPSEGEKKEGRSDFMGGFKLAIEGTGQFLI
jgi:hypothetical protein